MAVLIKGKKDDAPALQPFDSFDMESLLLKFGKWQFHYFLSKLHYAKKYQAPRKLSKTKPPFSGTLWKRKKAGYTVNRK